VSSEEHAGTCWETSLPTETISLPANVSNRISKTGLKWQQALTFSIKMTAVLCVQLVRLREKHGVPEI
jgi:hypothetical protein